MRFDVVIGNVVPIFGKREQYERFKWDMRHVGRIVEFMEPEEWVAVFSNYPECRKYAELKYVLVYEPTYFLNQIEDIARNIESGLRTMNDTEKLLILISRQIVALSTKVDELFEKIDDLDVSVDTDEIAEAVVDQIKDNYIGSVEDYIG